MTKTDAGATRRGFVKGAAAVAVAAVGAVPSLKPGPVAAMSPQDRDRDRDYYRGKFHVACNAYCFNTIMLQQLRGGPDTMDLMKLLDYCADPAHRFDSLDATGYYFPPGNFQGQPFVMPSSKYLRDFRRKAEDLGVPITGTGIHNDFASPDPVARAADVENFWRWIDVAHAIGAPTIRVFAGPVPAGYQWSTVAAWMVESLQQVAEYAEDAGVTACLQNHGDMLATSAEFIKVLGMIDNRRGLGANDDTGYFLDTFPNGRPDYYGGIARMLPYSINSQVKQYLVEVKHKVPDPSQRTDVIKLMQIFRASPYRRPIPIEVLEVFGVPYDPFAQVPQFLSQVRTALDVTAELRL